MHTSATREKPPSWDCALMPVGLPSRSYFESATARVLTQGGDARIELSAAGANAYGCAPRPDPGLLSFGSSTASVISESGFQAAVAMHTHLHAQPSRYQQELARQRQELSVLSGASHVPGTQLVLAASGTDLHLFAAHLAARGDATVLQAVMVEPSETGSGVPAAVSAAHFATKTSQGHFVQQGADRTSTPGRPPACVRLRHADGTLRSADDVDAEFAANVQRIVQSGGRCLLVVTDISKTGLLAPSKACATRLQQRYADRLEVLVDACQFRMSSTTLVDYLAQDFMVAITGSKFVGGPAFCGALLIPPDMARRSGDVPLHALGDYSSRFDWPRGCPAAEVLSTKNNLGLLLRWEAALAELRSFKAIPQDEITNILRTWAQAVTTRIATDPTFEALPVAPIKRVDSSLPGDWDSVQTIFPFILFKHTSSGQRQALSVAETALLYRQLREPQAPSGLGARFQLGQPVPCGQQAGTAVSALRMCASARLVVEAVSATQGVNLPIAQAMQAFDQLAALVRRLVR